MQLRHAAAVSTRCMCSPSNKETTACRVLQSRKQKALAAGVGLLLGAAAARPPTSNHLLTSTPAAELFCNGMSLALQSRSSPLSRRRTRSLGPAMPTTCPRSQSPSQTHTADPAGE